MSKRAVKKPMAMLLALVMVISTVLSVVPAKMSYAEDVAKTKIASLSFITPTDGEEIITYPSKLPCVDEKSGTTIDAYAKAGKVANATSKPVLGMSGWTMGDYWLLQFPAGGYENYTISFKPRSSGTGLRDFEVHYSLDGETWTKIEGSEYKATDNYSLVVTCDLPTDVTDAENLYIRMISTSDISARAGTSEKYAENEKAVASGVTNIGSVVLSGTTIAGYNPVTVNPVTATYTTGTVVNPTDEITLYSDSDEGAVIMMKVNDGEYTEYTTPFTLADLGANDDNTDFTITTYAELNGKKSAYSVYRYYTTEAVTVTIADARSKADGTERVQVEGIVNFTDTQNVYIEDNTAGINLSFATAPSDIAVGDKVLATGKKGTYNGLEQLTEVTYTKVSSDNTLYSTNATIAELLANPNDYECRRVHIENAVIGAINIAGNTSLKQDTNTTNIYKIPAITGIEENATVKLDAVVGYYNALQLRVVQASDVVKTADAPDNGDDGNDDLTGVTDPVTAEMVSQYSAKTIADIYAATSNDTVTVIGQVAYQFGNVYNNANSINSIIIQDVIDEQIMGLQIYDYSNTYTTGDIVLITGKIDTINGVRQISSVTKVEKVGTATLFKPQVLTIAQLLSGGDRYLSEYVLIKNATLGNYSSTGSTTITDATGTTALYKGALLPDGVAAGSVVNLYGAWSKYNTSYQLRNGASTDYVAMSADGSTVDTSITLPIANWTGSGEITTPTVYADKYTANDFLDTSASITHSSGSIPLLSSTSTSTGSTSYSLGSKGSLAGDYYEIKLSTELLGNIKLNYSMKGSKTGPKNFEILYSTDGIIFNSVGTKSITTDSTYEKFNVTLPNGANNVETLYIRLKVANSISISNATIGSTGTNYFNEVSVTGSPIVADNITGYPDITPDAGTARLGQEITITTKTEDAVIYYSFDGVSYLVYDKNNKPTFTELPATVTAYAKKDGLFDSVFITYGYTQEQVAPVKASPNGGARTLGTKVQLSCATEGATIQYSMDNGTTWLNYNSDVKISLDVLPATIITKAVVNGCKDSETTTCSYTLRENENYNIYFGQIHAHTDYSDGAGTCDQAFDYAKNTAKQIDFLAVTDHSNSFDNADKANILDGSMSTEWVEGHQLADKYTDSDFVGLYGYEMTWSNGLGHMNTFNTAGFQSRTQSSYSTYSTALNNYYTTIKTDTGSINQFNHPGTTFGDFSDFAHYDEDIDSLITLIEVGNGEGAIGSDGYFPSYEYYTRALDKGWHVSPTNNQDNHKGYWGDANTARTVILADSLTRDNIYDALRNMRTYATEDNDLEIQYTLNGEIMGTILDQTPDTAEIKVTLNDPTDAAIGKVEVIVNGGLSVATENVTTSSAEVNFTLPADYSYYYIRVTQPDKDTAVTAPVWVGKVEAVGISGVSTTAALPVKGEALDINLDLYNNEATDLEVNAIDFSIDDTIIHSVDLSKADLTSIPSYATKSYSFDYTHDGTGGVNINVTVNATLNGVDKVYKGVLKLTYVAPSMVTNVVIDGTHGNDYVTGYYGANMGNFTKIAADENVKVTIVTDKMTQDILDTCDLLIISAPAKKAGTANAGAYTVSHFEDSFLELVKGYTDRGGELIICGIADYQDTSDCQTSTEQNKLLSYIGATTRMNSDEAMDDVTNGGQAYRIYPTDYNKDSAYTTGVVDGQKYSAYSGCTVLLDADAVASGKAEYIVKGHSTTYSFDSKSLDSYYVEIEKGNAILLARETLTGGGNVFVSSTVFMSDFEVKAEQDNVWDLPYINKNVIVNIMNSIKKQMAVTNIADVRSGDMGEIYCVEGIVTAGTVSGNAFFDTIYIQDATGGINIFPINEGIIEVGQKVRVVGSLDQYLGDKELRVITAKVIDETKNVVAPTKMTTKESMNYETNGGKLVKVEGVITDVVIKNDIVETIMVKDSSGVNARVFIDGYILHSDSSSKTLESFVKVGNTISAVGLVSYDPDGERLRVRDRSEIVLVKEKSSTGSTADASGTSTNNDSITTVTDAEENTKTITKVIKDVDSNNNAVVTKITIVMDATTGETKEVKAEVILDSVLVTKEDGTSTISAEVMERALQEAAKYASANVPVEVTINVSTTSMVTQLNGKDVSKLAVVVTIPTSILNNDMIVISNMNIAKSVISNAKSTKKDIVVTVKSGTGKVVYSWSFNGKELKSSKNEVTDVNIAIALNPVTKNAQLNKLLESLSSTAKKQGITLDFGQSGILPSAATVRIYVGNNTGMEAGKKVYLYRYNEKATTGSKLKNEARLEEGSKVAYTVDKDGYITIDIKQCSTYVVLTSKASKEIVATLFEQVQSVSKKTISAKKTASIAIVLPLEAEGAKVVYSTSDKKVATVSSKGKVTAKKAGKATITAKVTINGVTKSYKTTITVK
ncbi:CehA/McbA family metallohydrolase [Anaerosporobacter sp.]|uniref:CehA/McbA family metallohydrolase n=1 Tax=Anaerosporobacter sp. TaxID=1872529 RepID=UPI00286EECAD|nr:CehA/McbA family metallohydrolase [Anaerosporobacter sp.]